MTNIFTEQDNEPEVKERGNFIITRSGARFFINEKDLSSVPIDDLAHALSYNCRFNGHVNQMYSVAEHSVHVSNLVPKADALWGLLHDLTESVIPDIPRPFKHLITGFMEYEDEMMENMAKSYHLPWPMPKSVKYIDKHIVAAEAKQLFDKTPDWIDSYDKIDMKVEGWSPEEAKRRFLERYEELMKDHMKDAA